MKKITRENKGITLVSLVITIVIMLILASIVITLAIGDKGIITRAKEAIELYKKAEENEKVQLNNLYTQLASVNGDEGISVGEITSIVEQIIDNKLLSKYPIGSIYISESETNPSEFIGGTWERYAQGRTLIGEGTGEDTNSVQKTFNPNEEGGEYEHTLTIAEMPSHNHGSIFYVYKAAGGAASCTLASSGTNYNTGYTGGSQSHNNIQPYITVYIWKRIG